jgi:hypothetical protein
MRPVFFSKIAISIPILFLVWGFAVFLICNTKLNGRRKDPLQRRNKMIEFYKVEWMDKESGID